MTEHWLHNLCCVMCRTHGLLVMYTSVCESTFTPPFYNSLYSRYIYQLSKGIRITWSLLHSISLLPKELLMLWSIQMLSVSMSICRYLPIYPSLSLCPMQSLHASVCKLILSVCLCIWQFHSQKRFKCFFFLALPSLTPTPPPHHHFISS